MVIKTDTINFIQSFLDELDRRAFKVEKASIFGSYAKGTQDEYSDIDLALVSSDFSGIRFLDNEKIIECTPYRYSKIETHPFIPSDFVSSNPFVNEIIKTGFKVR